MSSTQQIAQHLRHLYFGGNWTGVNLRDTLNDITWEQASEKIFGLNTIASLLFHINYYMKPISRVLDGEPLYASDRFSYDGPPITSNEDWKALISKVMSDGELLASQIEAMNEEKLFTEFSGEKYGTIYRNLIGVIEHTHYHLGQIMLLKKILNFSSDVEN